MRLGRSRAVLSTAVVLAGATCSGTSGPTAIEIPIDEVRIFGCSSVVVGFTCAFRAEALSDGVVVQNAPLQWFTQNQSVARVSEEGVVTGISPGETTVHVTNTTATVEAQKRILVIPPGTK